MLASVLASAASAASEPLTVNDAVYSKVQAEAGEQLYREHCLVCHDEEYFRPVLQAWNGQTLADFYSVMSATMPESNPGMLSRKDYVDILAYILSLNGYPSGDIELDYRDGMLDGITIARRAAD